MAIQQPTTADSSGEIWKAIPGFEGAYEASTLGRIRSMRFRSKSVDRPRAVPLILKPSVVLPKGYMRVNIGGRTWGVHRLVLMAFVGPAPSSAHEGAHEDGNPANNRIDNLQWKTSRENHADKKRHGTHRIGSAVASAKLTEAQVVEIRASGLLTHILAARYGVGHEAIRRARDGRRWGHVQQLTEKEKA